MRATRAQSLRGAYGVLLAFAAIVLSVMLAVPSALAEPTSKDEFKYLDSFNVIYVYAKAGDEIHVQVRPSEDKVKPGIFPDGPFKTYMYYTYNRKKGQMVYKSGGAQKYQLLDPDGNKVFDSDKSEPDLFLPDSQVSKEYRGLRAKWNALPAQKKEGGR